jgi:hypothetical protein
MALSVGVDFVVTQFAGSIGLYALLLSSSLSLELE